MMKKLLVGALVLSLSIFMVGCIDNEDIQDSKTEESVREVAENNSALSWEQIGGILEARYNIFGKEQLLTDVNQTNLMQGQPAPMLKWSSERGNLIERTNRFNDPNKISYIYLMTNNGQVVGFFDVKGKVSSVNSALTSSQMAVRTGGYNDSPVVTVESPQMDGSYGTNGDAIFWFDSSDMYHEWNGIYFLSDQPVKLSVQPIMVESITVTE